MPPKPRPKRRRRVHKPRFQLSRRGKQLEAKLNDIINNEILEHRRIPRSRLHDMLSKFAFGEKQKSVKLESTKFEVTKSSTMALKIKQLGKSSEKEKIKESLKKQPKSLELASVPKESALTPKESVQTPKEPAQTPKELAPAPKEPVKAEVKEVKQTENQEEESEEEQEDTPDEEDEEGEEEGGKETPKVTNDDNSKEPESKDTDSSTNQNAPLKTGQPIKENLTKECVKTTDVNSGNKGTTNVTDTAANEKVGELHKLIEDIIKTTKTLEKSLKTNKSGQLQPKQPTEKQPTADQQESKE